MLLFFLIQSFLLLTTSFLSAVADDASYYECLTCETDNTVTVLCNFCYASGTASRTHNHNETHFVCATDPVVPDFGRSSASDAWKTRMNVQGRLWYQNEDQKARTFVRPQ
jgi:hypothetical protein